MNQHQEIYLKLLRNVDFENFDGIAISEDLESLGLTIRGFIPVSSFGSLRSLYRLIGGTLEVDTLLVMVEIYDVHIITRYGKEWGANSITVISGRELEGAIGINAWESEELAVVKLWWDIT